MSGSLYVRCVKEYEMQLLRWTLAGSLIVGLAGCGNPTSTSPTNASKPTDGSKPTNTSTVEVSNKDKIVGVWELVKGSDLPPGTSFEFMKDGKMKVSIKDGDKTTEMNGTYKVEGDKLTNAGKGPDGKEQKETDTIVKLTDTELVIKDDKHNKTLEFKKRK
jgi:uncharacterized protein (TIGR03066 family)